MKRLLITALLSSALALPAYAALKSGEKAPDFSAKASLAGKEFNFSLKDALKKGPVVVYFYPAAFTGGCNIEAHNFAENKEKFEAAHTTIIGVSLDTIDRLNAFSADPQYCAGKFPVASDPDGTIAKSYSLNVAAMRAGIKDSRGEEIKNAGFADRVTFIITPDSKIVGTFNSTNDQPDKITPGEHAEKSLALLQTMKK